MTDIAIAPTAPVASYSSASKATGSSLKSGGEFANLMNPIKSAAAGTTNGKLLPVAQPASVALTVLVAALPIEVSDGIQASLAAFLETAGIPSTTTQIPDAVMDAWIETELPLLAVELPALADALDQLTTIAAPSPTPLPLSIPPVEATNSAVPMRVAATETPAIASVTTRTASPERADTQRNFIALAAGTRADSASTLPKASLAPVATMAVPTAQGAITPDAAGLIVTTREPSGLNKPEQTALSRLANALNTQSAQTPANTASTGYVPLATLNSALPAPAISQVVDEVNAMIGSPGAARPEAPVISTARMPTDGSLGLAENVTEGRLMAARVEASAAAPAPTRAEAPAAPVAGDTKLPHFDDPAWLRSVGEKAQMMLRNAQPEARLRLDPSHLGTIELKVAQGNDGTQITMVATDGRVRDALEAGQNRLRDQLAEQGVSLSQFDVSDQAQQQTARDSDDQPQTGQGQASADVDSLSDSTDDKSATSLAANDRLVDQRV
ncbi:hypothetical protein GH975_06530 [Litorivicinus lipolyticus]|uniref:Flagellar hook-length control protein-like C-terminal domain-containing protein n=2 Tax=Litorivicinus lipolyticus TaxID=418701 RepID=A0A5Q2Q768_9GAMM|nr:hypothetical protein GH975_06530 [Litorivicinus lipolyticus]